MSKFDLTADNIILKKDREIFMNLGEIRNHLGENRLISHALLSLRMELRGLELCLIQSDYDKEPELGIWADHGSGMSLASFANHYKNFHDDWIPTFKGRAPDDDRRFGVHHILELPWNDIRRPQLVLWSV